MAEEWFGRVRGAVAQDFKSRRARQQLKSIRADLEGLLQRLDAAERLVEDRESELAQAMEQLGEMRQDPIVLVRSYGAYVNVYHFAEDPCGWVKANWGYDRLLWGEARARGLRPCTACGYLADGAARRGRSAQLPATG